jgi:hypothetical protein
MTSHSHVRYKEILARTSCGPLFSSVKLSSHTMSMCVSSARAEPFRKVMSPIRVWPCCMETPAGHEPFRQILADRLCRQAKGLVTCCCLYVEGLVTFCFVSKGS